MRLSGQLRSEERKFLTEVSAQPVGPIFKGQEIQGMNYHYTLHNTPQERRSYLLRGGSLKSLINCYHKIK
jgi:hypothetical protein